MVVTSEEQKRIHRAELERKALRLGIPWTLQTTDESLESLIEDRERRLTMPSEETRDGVLYIDGFPQPDCFGDAWAGVGDKDCARCIFQDHCLDRFASTALVEAQEEHPGDLPAIAEELGLPEEAIIKAMEYQVSKSKKKAPAKKAAAKKPPAKKPPKKTVEAAEPQPAPQTEAPTTRKRRPPKAGASVKRASAPASSRKKSATSAKARADLVQDNFTARWERERRRLPVLKKFLPGMRLRREYGGEIREMVVLKIGYQYRGTAYATTYEVTGEITGWREYPKQERNGVRPEGVRRMSAWSPSRFWQFEKVAEGQVI